MPRHAAERLGLPSAAGVLERHVTGVAPWRSYALMHLWSVLEPTVLDGSHAEVTESESLLRRERVGSGSPVRSPGMIDSAPRENRRIVLRRRPVGLVQADDVELVTEAVGTPGDGEILIQVEWLGIDASVRTWLNRGEGYLPPVEIDEVVRCSGIGRVLESQSDRFVVGDLAYSLPGWQEYAVVSDHYQVSNPLPAGAEPTAMMSIYGAVGATAWMGIVDIGEAKEGETVVVSAAAGATGSLAAQIAHNLGCRVVGICGSDEKCGWLTKSSASTARSTTAPQDVPAALRELCPDRVDVYFDNVGGEILDAVLGHLALHGRVALCGADLGLQRGAPTARAGELPEPHQPSRPNAGLPVARHRAPLRRDRDAARDVGGGRQADVAGAHLRGPRGRAERPERDVHR